MNLVLVSELPSGQPHPDYGLLVTWAFTIKLHLTAPIPSQSTFSGSHYIHLNRKWETSNNDDTTKAVRYRGE